ncbi:hypothetical protein E3N88_09209 [Mikania micrantha]|uniref:Integrase catalytic domain-containing protein n=1 Tax=Mikania micrantha TaxID=192012 RepID=A0A5N6PKP1_9ASTR|nr:hypothetical protein E3N88_09209 [Mikania micrantha]
MKWGMDIVGKLPKAPGEKVFMLAMTDYFSKWIKAEAFTQVREKEVISLIKRNILTRFGIPTEITCDNGSQFRNIRVRTFQIGDLALRKAFQNTTNPADGKLAPK